MNFGTNLTNARKAKGLSQEELAEMLCVSRQTIYKWEAGITYPDVDKLCDIARCLGVSTAYLLGEDIREADPVFSVCEIAEEKKDVGISDKASAVRHFKGFANVIGLCTMAILFAVSIFVGVGGLGGDGAALWGLIPFLAIIFGAVIGFVIAGIRHDQYLQENAVAPFFDQDKKKREQRTFTAKIVTGLSLIFLGVLFVILGGVLNSDFLSVVAVVALLALIGVACYFFITAGILYDFYMGEKSPRKHHDKSSELAEGICGAIMMIATAVFLLLGFVWNLWHPGWVAFPIGGLLCGCVSKILGEKEK